MKIAPADFSIVRERLVTLAGRPGVSPALLGFRSSVFSAQVGVYLDLAGGGRNGGRMYDPVQAGRLLSGIGAIAKAFGALPGAMDSMIAFQASDPGFAAGLAEKAAGARTLGEYSKSLKSGAESPDDGAFFIGRLIAAPFVTAAVQPERRDAPLSEPGCPACGSLPSLASLARAGGTRELHCSLCGHSWRYNRSSCPFCGQHERLEILRPDDGDPRWIEGCARCGMAIKVLDAGKADPASLPVSPLCESISGLYLDIIAGEHGFKAAPPCACLL